MVYVVRRIWQTSYKAEGIDSYGGKWTEFTNRFERAGIANGNCFCGTVFSLDVGLGAFVKFVVPNGNVGSVIQILGTGLTGSTAVSFNGVPASSFKVVRDTFMTATVPAGATTGRVKVTTPTGKLISNVKFKVLR
jgi:hypothetical protein